MIRRVVLVSGTRGGVEESLVFGVLDNILKGYDPLELVVIHGNAKGVDSQADKWCRMNGVHALKCDAMWVRYDKKAGSFRNNVMIEVLEWLNRVVNILSNETGSCDLEVSVEAFPPSHEYGGTRHAIKESLECGLTVNVHENK